MSERKKQTLLCILQKYEKEREKDKLFYCNKQHKDEKRRKIIKYFYLLMIELERNDCCFSIE